MRQAALGQIRLLNIEIMKYYEGVTLMGLYEGIKDIANIVQKADNIDLYRQLLDLGAQALDMQS